MAQVELKNVAKSFGKTEVIRDVYLSIEKGEFVVFVGPSGCGKSTLLRLIAGLENLTEGEIIIADKPVMDLPPSERGIAMVFQSYALFPNMSVKANIGYGLKMKKLPKADIEARVSEVLEMCQLHDYAQRAVTALSGGQRQRVAIARAIILEPKLILLDEPTSALDVSIQMQILNLLKDLQSRLGLAYLCISHDLKVIRFLSDYVYVMKDGNIVEDGISDDLFESPNHIYTQELLAASIV